MIFHQHQDAALLILCGELRILQEEWQRLWEATPVDNADGPAEAVWHDYSDKVWPGIGNAAHQDDPVRGLVCMCATTLEGMQAKAAAIKALDDACGYLESVRDDSYELMVSVLQDVAGSATMFMGEDADLDEVADKVRSKGLFARPVPLHLRQTPDPVSL